MERCSDDVVLLANAGCLKKKKDSNKIWFLHILFIMIIFTNETNLYEFEA